MSSGSGAKRLIVIVGATGSGKTDLSIELATRFAAPIVSTDSRQVYRGMPIGTAQPTAKQLQSVEHHFIAELEPDAEFNCGTFERCALERLDELFQRRDYVVAVGGSGLYIQALCEGMDSLPEADSELRQELVNRLENNGIDDLLRELHQLDPAYYDIVDKQNRARVLRAVEVCRLSGQPYSALRLGQKSRRPFEIIKIGVDMPREELYERINRRVDMMIAQGLEAEVRQMLPYRNCNALQTVGYKEMFDYLDGIISRQEAIELIKRNSRRYAKRQMTWFRRDEQIRWFERGNADAIAEYIAHFE